MVLQGGLKKIIFFKFEAWKIDDAGALQRGFFAASVRNFLNKVSCNGWIECEGNIVGTLKIKWFRVDNNDILFIR